MSMTVKQRQKLQLALTALERLRRADVPQGTKQTLCRVYVDSEGLTKEAKDVPLAVKAYILNYITPSLETLLNEKLTVWRKDRINEALKMLYSLANAGFRNESRCSVYTALGKPLTTDEIPREIRIYIDSWIITRLTEVLEKTCPGGFFSV